MATERSQRQVLVAFAAIMLATLLAALDQTIVATALPQIAARPAGLRAPQLGGHRVPAGRRTVTVPLYGKLSDLVRPPAAVRGRDQRCSSPAPRCAGSRRTMHAADRVPRAAGPRRRRAAAAQPGGDRRPLLAARARPLPGLHRLGVGRRRASPGRCSAARSPTPSPGAGSSGSTSRSAAFALVVVMRTMRPGGRTREHADRLAGARRAERRRLVRSCSPARGRGPTSRGRRRRCSPRSRSARVSIVVFLVVERRAPEPLLPLDALPRPHVRRLHQRRAGHRRRPVRDHDLRPRLHAGRARGLGDQLGRGPDPAHVRLGGGELHLRPAHLQDRPLPRLSAARIEPRTGRLPAAHPARRRHLTRAAPPPTWW